MKILAVDTSFLFSLLGKDVHTQRAREFIANLRSEIFCTPLNTFEFTNSVLHAEFAGFIEVGLSSKILHRWQENIHEERIKIVNPNLASILRKALSLTKEFTLTQGHRTYDILLVAAALELRATHFLTFDKRQARLAESQGLEVPIDS